MLKINDRIYFKLCTLIWRTVNLMAPQYMNNIISVKRYEIPSSGV